MKTCVTCRYYIKWSGSCEKALIHNSKKEKLKVTTYIDPVTGREEKEYPIGIRESYTSAHILRNGKSLHPDDDVCDPSGKGWEPKRNLSWLLNKILPLRTEI
jgi:hypothetical protein